MLLKEEIEALKTAGEKELLADIPTAKSILRKLK